MSRYGSAIYGASKYGETPKLAFSVEPMAINVIDFTKVRIDWLQPSGNFSRFRLVRNQSQFPETAEDGIIIFEQSSIDGSSIEGQVATTTFIDGEDNPSDIPLTSGNQIYYRVFLFTSEKIWVTAGSVTDIVPFNTGATKKTLDLLPRVITSKENSPFGVIDETTEIYNFIDAIAFTYEQFSSHITLLRPQHKRDKSLYATIPGETLNYGLYIEPNLPVSNQHRLIREAIYLYKNRGTILGLEGISEALTGYIPTVNVSNNLLLTIQDSTFYDSVGNWVTEDGTLEASEEEIAEPGELVIDATFSCKVTPSSAGSMTLGYDNVITKGVPVTAETEYAVNAKVKCPTSGQNVTLQIEFYDKDGISLGTDSNSIATNNTWQLLSFETTTPVGTSYSALTISWDGTDVFYVDQVYVGLTPFNQFDEARAISIDLDPIKINYINNPSFEIDDSTWNVTGATFSQDSSTPYQGYSGDYSGKFVAAGSWSISNDYYIPVEPGSYITLSFYNKSDDLSSITVTIDTYDIDDVLVETITQSCPVDTDWTRFSISKLISSESTETHAVITVSGEAGTIYLDMFQFEDAYKATDYFDGSMPSQYGAVWYGDAHASRTYLYPNKLTKIPRLAYSLPEWVPLNAWWRLRVAGELEYTNLQV